MAGVGESIEVVPDYDSNYALLELLRGHHVQIVHERDRVEYRIRVSRFLGHVDHDLVVQVYPRG